MKFQEICNYHVNMEDEHVLNINIWDEIEKPGWNEDMCFCCENKNLFEF